MYIPGCVEHYLVYTMREHPDSIRELAFVLEWDGQIVGSILYTKTTLTDEKRNMKPGPWMAGSGITNTVRIMSHSFLA